MKQTIKSIAKKLGIAVRRIPPFEAKHGNIYKKYKNFTMIPENIYIDNLDIVNKFSHLKGNVVECGVWRGGMIAGMAEVLGAERKYFLCDSFEGLPQATEKDGKSAIEWQLDTTGINYYDNCSAEETFADTAMKLADVDFKLVKGWFDANLPSLDTGTIGVLRLDADWYDSTYCCFQNLYPHVVTNGLIIIDDYFAWDGCSKAVHAYLAQTSSKIYTSNAGTAYIIKRDE